jgi:hypothetical protein
MPPGGDQLHGYGDGKDAVKYHQRALVQGALGSNRTL